MRCTCGWEILEGSKYCGNCGKPVPVIDVSKCVHCGKTLIPGASYCGQCGKPVSSIEVSRCVRCGKPLAPGARICGACSGGATKTTPLKEKVKQAHDWLDSRIVNKSKAKRLLIFALVIGLCFTFTGLAGKIMMDGLANSLQEAGIVSEMFGLDEDELGKSLDRKAGTMVTKFVISVIKNDPSIAVDASKKFLSAVGGDDAEFVISFIVEIAFEEARAAFIEEAGALWPLLQIMAYYNEFLVIGLVAAVAAAVLLYLLDGKLSDIQNLKTQYAVYIGCTWCVLAIVAAIIVRFNMNIGEL